MAAPLNAHGAHAQHAGVDRWQSSRLAKTAALGPGDLLGSCSPERLLAPLPGSHRTWPHMHGGATPRKIQLWAGELPAIACAGACTAVAGMLDRLLRYRARGSARVQGEQFRAASRGVLLMRRRGVQELRPPRAGGLAAGGVQVWGGDGTAA